MADHPSDDVRVQPRRLLRAKPLVAEPLTEAPSPGPAAPVPIQPAYQPEYQQPPYQQPPYQQPPYQQPPYQPEYQQPPYQQPPYQQPPYQQPPYQQPEYQPEYQQPEYQQPPYQQPAYPQPILVEPAHQQPIPVQPYVPQPIPVQPYVPQAIPVQPYVTEPIPVQPMYLPPQPMPVQPVALHQASIGPPAPVQPEYVPAPTHAPELQPQPQSQPMASSQREFAAEAPMAAAKPATKTVAATGSTAAAGGPVKAAPVLLSKEQKRKQLPTQQRRRTPGKKALGVREEMQERQEEGAAAVWWRDFLAEHRSWASSAVVHMALLIVFAVWFVSFQQPRPMLILSSADEEEELLDEITDVPIDGPDLLPLANDIVDRPEPESLQPLIDMQSASEGVDAASQMLVKDSISHIPYNDILSELGTGTGKENQLGTGKGNKGTGYGLDGMGMGLGGRGGRRGVATSRGATKESETAVDSALKWLADHQLPDGSWSFNHQLAPLCQGQCPNPGELNQCRLAPTAMGVLPFLGAGQTNQVGKYQQTVGAALNYLVQHTIIDERGGRLLEPEGRMYGHGLAAIALCEAFAMQVNPNDLKRMKAPEYDGSGEANAPKKREAKEVPVPNLGLVAQQSLKFIMYAQDPNGGGWRYQPREAGDTSVVGWQMMALMSGRIAYMQIPQLTLDGASKFLDSVQRDDYGADYGYLDKSRGTNATQAIGLLCRMYLGWKRDHPGIVQGVEALDRTGPRDGNMYYNYYATQVLHHYGGDEWERWNPRMRDSLVAAQSKAGHTAGSWYFGHGDHGGSKGGRLYYTSLCALTLEVYYRHLPIYRNENFFEGVGRQNKPDGPDAGNAPDKPADEF